MSTISPNMQKFINSFKKVNNSINKTCLFDMRENIWFTDGSCTKNGKICAKGGYSAICTNGITAGAILYRRLNVNEKPTNIRAEGMAIQTVFERLVLDVNLDTWYSATIYTDSEFWVKMIYDYMPKWSSDNFNAKANPDLTKKIWSLWNHLKKTNKKIEVVHIYGHNKDNSATSKDPLKRYCHDNNKLADQLANIARENEDYKLHEEQIY